MTMRATKAARTPPTTSPTASESLGEPPSLRGTGDADGDAVGEWARPGLGRGVALGEAVGAPPVPLSATAKLGVSRSSERTLIVAVRRPAARGVIRTLNTNDPLAGTVTGMGGRPVNSKSTALTPRTWIALILSGAPPSLETVTGTSAPGFPTGEAPA